MAAAVAGLVGYGLWAAYANAPHGGAVALRSGVVQGSYSFVLTLVMSLVTEWVYARLAGMRLRAPLRAPLTVAVVAGALFATAYGLNAAAGTPEILATIAPGFAIGTLYTGVYVVGLLRDEPRVQVDSP